MELAGVLRTRVAPRPWKGPRQPFCRSDATMQPDTVVNAAACSSLRQAAQLIQCRASPSDKVRQVILWMRLPCSPPLWLKRCMWLHQAQVAQRKSCARIARSDTA